jgi:polar amino acid transport system substrate-binding protein
MLFEASNALAVFSKLMTEPLPVIESGSGAFDDLLRRMLDRDPVARPSAAAAAELLRTIAAGAANTTSRTSDPTGTTPTAGLADAGPRPARRTAADATVADAPSTFPTPWNDGGTERQPRPVQRARRTRILIAVAVVTSIVAAIAVVILAGGSGQPSRSAGNSSAGSGSSTPGPRRTRSTTAPLAGLLPDTIRETGIVRVASDYPYPPYEFMTGNSLTGFEYDLTQAMAQRLGVTFKWVRQPFTEIIPGVMSGNFDVGMSGITDTRAREEAVDFVDYGFTREAILVKKGDPRGIAGRGSLCGLRVLVVFATPQAEELQKESDECIQGGKPAVTMLGRDPSTASAVSAIISGKADATIEDAATATYLAKTIDDGSALDAVPFSDKANSRDPLGIAVSKSDSQLSAALKQTLTALIEDGTYANILRKYGIESLGATSITINAATS